MHCNLDIHEEHMISLREAAKHLPKRNGRRAHYSTIFRWATKGARGRKLESVLIGGVRYTSIEAMRRFSSLAAKPQDDTSSWIAQVLANEGV